jgi:hypothetical protein
MSRFARQHVLPLSATVHMPSVRRYRSAPSRGVFRHGIVGGRVRHNQFASVSPHGAMSAITGSADGCPFSSRACE